LLALLGEKAEPFATGDDANKKTIKLKLKNTKKEN
jgi:hypothetical protein